MPKRGIINSNQKHNIKDKEKKKEINTIFRYLNKLKPKGATKQEICQKTNLSESKVQRHLEYLQFEPQKYGNKSYEVKREGYTYIVLVTDKDGTIIDYGNFTRRNWWQ